MSTADPKLDNWYQDPATGRTFRVVAIEDESDSIEVQYFNGDLGEFDYSSWDESAFSEIEAPEDWSAPFDDLEIDDLGYSDPDIHSPGIQDVTLDDILNDDEY
jgi:hypothetical protein